MLHCLDSLWYGLFSVYIAVLDLWFGLLLGFALNFVLDASVACLFVDYVCLCCCLVRLFVFAVVALLVNFG